MVTVTKRGAFGVKSTETSEVVEVFDSRIEAEGHASRANRITGANVYVVVESNDA